MYQQIIRDEAAKMGFIGKYDPRHIEAWMRLEHSCLDGLYKEQFNDEIKTGIQCIDAVGLTESESLAASFGL